MASSQLVECDKAENIDRSNCDTIFTLFITQYHLSLNALKNAQIFAISTCLRQQQQQQKTD